MERQNGVNQVALAHPFFGTGATTYQFQEVYTPDEVGAEGVVRRFAFNRTIMDIGNFSNVAIFMGHTSRTNLSTVSFADNYEGRFPIEVYRAANVVMNSSNDDSWIYFDLNDNFTYDSAYNLLVDIQWSGSGGTSINLDSINTVDDRIVRSIDGGALFIVNRRLVTRFWVDVGDNCVVESSALPTVWPFNPNAASESRCQMLFNHTLLNQSGIIDKLRFQAASAGLDWAVLENVSIRLAHSTNDTLGTVFEAHRSSAWVEVLNKASLNLSASGLYEWIEIDVSNLFTYNNVNNLLIDIRWDGGNTLDGALDVYAVSPTVLNYFLRATSYAATTGVSWNRMYNLQAIFADSANLTWTAASSTPTMFTAGVSGRTLTITPMPDKFGTGTVTLTLRNSNGLTTSQAIPVTITAVNDAPILGALYNIKCVEDVPFTMNISANITDIDDPIKNITVSTDSTYASINGTNITFTYPEGVHNETVVITIEDGGGGSDSQTIEVSVTMVNDDPYLTGFVSTVTCDATVAKHIALTPGDEETPTGQLNIIVNSPYVNVTGHTLVLTYPKGIGTDQVTIYLVDNLTYGSQNNVSYTLDVTIIDHPDVVANSPTGTTVAVTSPVVVTFDMAMNHTKAQNAFKMTFGTAQVNGTFTWSTDGKIMTYTPSTHMTNGLYNVEVAASAENVSGVKMLNAFRWNFTAVLGTFDGDGDGMPDQWEMDNDLDPNVDDAEDDADGDGMPNIFEFESNLDPQVNDADEDADGDGATNFEEYEAGTDPNDENDAPAADMGWLPILMAVIVIAVIAAVVLWLMLGRKKKPAQTRPGQQTAYQELRELKPEVPPDQPQQGGQPAGGPEQPPVDQGPPSQPQTNMPPPGQGDQQPPPPGQ